MTDTELDNVYTALCKTMTAVGEDKAQLYLARFALLAISQIDNAEVSLSLIKEAGDNIA